MSADTTLMPIPGAIDPVPVPRGPAARADGKVELVGLSKDRVRQALEAAGLDPKQAKLRAKQLWHWIYNRGASDFAAMSDIAQDVGTLEPGGSSTFTFTVSLPDDAPFANQGEPATASYSWVNSDAGTSGTFQ